MDKFTVLESLVVPLDRANIDTDQIIPQKYLQSIKRTGFGDACFAAWRRDPQFVLNQPRYKGGQILLARKNFGIGSSREHAPWALRDYGFRAVIAPSFGEIFQNNSLKNGFLPIALTDSEVDKLFYDAASFGCVEGLDVDASGATQFIADSCGGRVRVVSGGIINTVAGGGRSTSGGGHRGSPRCQEGEVIVT